MGVVNICMMRRIGRGGYELSNLGGFFLWGGLVWFGFGLVRFVRDNSKKRRNDNGRRDMKYQVAWEEQILSVNEYL